MTRFAKLVLAATAATFFLIGVGGFVRAAGAGLGCPDWPRCFDRWYPPTDVGQLPPDVDPARFNFALAWIEYANRLVGVTVGLLIAAVAAAAWRAPRHRLDILFPAVACVLLVAFQGWFGGQVVAYELDHRFVTVHLVLALVLGGLLLHLTVVAVDAGGGRLPRPTADDGLPRRLAGLSLVLTLAQIFLGALVRGSLEILFDATPDLPRAAALDRLGGIAAVHEAGAVVTLLACAGLFAAARLRLADRPRLARWAQVPAWLAIAQVAIGAGLAARALPPALQLAHLVVGSLLFASLAFVVLLLAPSREAHPG